MSKKQMQEGKQGGEDERVVSKSGPARNLVTVTLNRAEFELISQPGESQNKMFNLGFKENSTSSSQVWHTDSVPNSSTGKPGARSKKQSTIGQNFIPHNLTMAPHSVGCMDKVFVVNVRQKFGRPKEDKMEQIETNGTIW